MLDLNSFIDSIIYMKAFYTLIILLIPFIGFRQCIKGNCKNGQGTYTWPSGDKYVGEYKDSKRHGKGTLLGLVEINT